MSERNLFRNSVRMQRYAARIIRKYQTKNPFHSCKGLLMNHLRDMMYEDTPLHFSLSSELLEDDDCLATTCGVLSSLCAYHLNYPPRGLFAKQREENIDRVRMGSYMYMREKCLITEWEYRQLLPEIVGSPRPRR